MLSLVILCASFGLLLAINKRLKRRFFTPSGILLAEYFLCSLATLYLFWREPFSLDLGAVIYYVLALGILLLPIALFDETRSVGIEARDTFPEVFVSLFLAIIGLYALVYHLSYIAPSLTGNLADNRQYVTALENNVFTVWSDIAASGSYLFSLMIPLGFYWLASRRRRLLGWALLVASCSYPAYVLRYVGRDAIIMWGCAFAFNLLLFAGNLSARTKKWLFLSYTFGMCILFVFFINISVDRFSLAGSWSIDPFADYAGQSPLHFSQEFQANHALGYGQLNFNIVSRVGSLLGLTAYNDDFLRDYAEQAETSDKLNIFVFSSIVGCFLMDFGKYGTAVLILCVAVVMFRTLGRGGQRMPLWQIIIYTMYMQVMIGGIFYYYYYLNVGNAALLFSVGTAVAIKFSRRKRAKTADLRLLLPKANVGKATV